ncbi:hypothetical protein [Bartonella apihabitans]|uniref:hypothetical protein n=1 Tax=Bartonella apihabitans TaxID=2750929 RepID=UPI003BB7CDFC
MNAVEDTQLTQLTQLTLALYLGITFLVGTFLMAMFCDDEDSRFYTKGAIIISILCMVANYRLDQFFTNNAMSLRAIGFFVALCIALAIVCCYLAFGWPSNTALPFYFALIFFIVVVLGFSQVRYFYARFDPDNTKATIEHTVDHCPCPPDQAPLGEQK